jgi:hypothetical protein
VAQIVSVTNWLTQEFQSEHFTVASHKQYAHAHSHFLKIQQMQPSSQQMLQHAVSTLMESHLLSTLMFHKITKITSTVQAVRPVLVNLVLL